ncbi:MAG TPA: EAL domain-containing protein, partial [Nevskiaceae bacterium]|nr:EAL domain-containing protein [Nevskiaceae bacterium]
MVDAARVDCRQCRDAEALSFDFSMAFQPIVDLDSRQPLAHEALVRGPAGEGADWVFARVNPDNRYRFDQACRVKAIELAARLGLPGYLSINFMPNAVYDPAACLRTTLAAADRFGFPTDRIVFEFTEGERVEDLRHLKRIVQHYQSRGFRVALDDFGAGYAGLGLLTELQPDVIKLDMSLIRGLDQDPRRRAIVEHTHALCRSLGIL